MWPYCRLGSRAHRGHMFCEVDHWPGIGFLIKCVPKLDRVPIPSGVFCPQLTRPAKHCKDRSKSISVKGTVGLLCYNCTLQSQLNLTPPSQLYSITTPLNLTKLNSTNTTILYHHNLTPPSQLYSTITTQLDSTSLSQLYSTITTQLNLTWLHHPGSCQLVTLGEREFVHAKANFGTN